jgi:NADPH2:quinone reductase
MKAVWLTEYGGPEVLVARETPDPLPGHGDVVVGVAAASITFIETLVRANRIPWPSGGSIPPYVPGNGVGGTVASVGDGVDASWVGQRVVTTTGGQGGYAERVAVPASRLIPVPDGVGINEATALLADGRTALGLVEVAAPKPGERVLVLAAGGGLGSILVQLCRAAGASVIAAAGGERKLAVARDLGADEVVNYTLPGWEPTTVDIAFDGVGGELGASALAAVRPGGRFVSYGVASGAPTPASRDDVTTYGFEALSGIAARASELTARVLAEAAAGRLHPVIGQTFPLAEAAAAHAAMESRSTVGKTLLIT